MESKSLVTMPTNDIENPTHCTQTYDILIIGL